MFFTISLTVFYVHLLLSRFKFSENRSVIVKIGLHVLLYEDAFWTGKKPQSKSLYISCILIGTRAYFTFIFIAIYLVGSIFFVCNPVLFVQWSLNLIFRHVICIMHRRTLGSYCADSVTLREFDLYKGNRGNLKGAKFLSVLEKRKTK